MSGAADKAQTSRGSVPDHTDKIDDAVFALAELPTSSAPWKKFYGRGLAISDLVLLTIATVLAVILRFGLDSDVTTNGPLNLGYTGLGVGIAAAWWAMLSIFRSRDHRIIGEGAEEYRRIVRITFWLFGGLAILSMMLKVDMSRGYLATAFPLGLVPAPDQPQDLAGLAPAIAHAGSQHLARPGHRRNPVGRAHDARPRQASSGQDSRSAACGCPTAPPTSTNGWTSPIDSSRSWGPRGRWKTPWRSRR